jgi:hypothetical protein
LNLLNLVGLVSRGRGAEILKRHRDINVLDAVAAHDCRLELPNRVTDQSRAEGFDLLHVQIPGGLSGPVFLYKFDQVELQLPRRDLETSLHWNIDVFINTLIGVVGLLSAVGRYVILYVSRGPVIVGKAETYEYLAHGRHSVVVRDRESSGVHVRLETYQGVAKSVLFQLVL